MPLRFLCDRYIFVTEALLSVVLATPQGAFAWGRGGHQITVIAAEHYMRPETAARMGELLAPDTPEEAIAIQLRPLFLSPREPASVPG